MGKDNLAFYQTAATVIPVLFIALVVHMHYFRPMERQWPSMTMAGLGILAIVGYGEGHAFRVLLNGQATDFDEARVKVALLITGMSLLAEVALPSFLRLFKDASGSRSKRIGVWFLLLFYVAAIVLGAVEVLR